MNKCFKSIVIILLCCVLINACSHKSGHKRQNNKKETIEQNSSDKLKSLRKKSNGSNKRLDGSEIFEKCNSAVFMIIGSNVQGSGFFLSKDGLAISNYHVIKELYSGNDVVVLSNGDRYSIIEVIKYSESYDYAVFTTTCKHTNYLNMTRISPKVGDKVFTIGSPRGLQNTLSSGEISQIRDKYIMQINTPIDHGSSGGALINEYGDVIGITTAGFEQSNANLNFAIKIDVIEEH